MFNKNPNSRELTTGFTLIELLIVIGILAVLATIATLTINPVELLRQSRDARRMVELNNIELALEFYKSSGGTGFGSANTVYISLPSANSDCSGLGLPALPSGWVYRCATEANYRKVDGGGWIPVNFASVGTTLFPVLPIDPVNVASSRNYYSYTPGGSWEIAAAMESEAYKAGGSKDIASKDGGQNISLYELGTNLSLIPVEYGDSSLAGYWKFNETSGAISDSSGNGRGATQTGGITYGASGKAGTAFGFDGGDDDVVLNSTIAMGNGNWTVSAWVKTSSGGSVLSNNSGGPVGNDFEVSTGKIGYRNYDGAWQYHYGTSTVNNNSWRFLTWVNFSNQTMKMYVDAGLDAGPFNSYTTNGGPVNSIGRDWSASMNGYIDDVRYYTRALSEAEIRAIYLAAN